jgi:hypothetical protein
VPDKIKKIEFMKKVCSTCKQEKEVSEFTKNKSSKDGYHNQCKVCRKEEYQRNKEHKLEYIKEYYKENKKEINEKHKEYYDKNREKVSDRGKIYRENNKEIISQKKKEYYDNGYKEVMKERAKQRRANGEFFEIDRNHRHKRRAACKETDVTNEFLKELKESTKGICPICGVIMTEENGEPNQYNLDHVFPLSKGGKHICENVRYICRTCNLKKRDKL